MYILINDNNNIIIRCTNRYMIYIPQICDYIIIMRWYTIYISIRIRKPCVHTLILPTHLQNTQLHNTRYAGALAWRRGPVCACTRVCWCRRIFTYIHAHTYNTHLHTSTTKTHKHTHTHTETTSPYTTNAFAARERHWCMPTPIPQKMCAHTTRCTVQFTYIYLCLLVVYVLCLAWGLPAAALARRVRR